MSLFAPKTSERILLLTAGALHVYAGEKDGLVEEGSFPADDQGLAGFGRHLGASPDSPVHLVVDLSEEDFRIEAIAHVSGKDRKVLLERKLLQFFRGSEYRSARIQDREEGGRRDDRVLFSALTNPELLTPWIDCLLRQKIRIKGIISVPLLMERFSAFLQLDRLPHLLLVNLEEQVGLRQSYLQKGRLKFSRLLSVTKQDGLAEMLLAECRQTRQYLERLKLLPHDRPLQVHICAADGMTEGFAGALVTTTLLQFHFHETGMIGAELGIDPATLQECGVVYCSLRMALQTRKFFNAYAPPPITRYHRLRQIRHGLIVGTSLLVAFILLAGGLLLHEGFTTIGEKQRLDLETLRFQKHLAELQRTFPETPIPAMEMRTVVESVERIRSQEILPMRAMVMVSRAMALFPNLKVQRFEWQLSVSAETDAAGAIMPAGATELGPGTEGQVPVPMIVPGLLEGKTVATTVLSGMVFPSRGYGNAQQSINQFIVALEENPGMKVIPLSMPTETKPSATVKAKLDDGDILAEFSLKIDYRAAQ